MNLSQIPAILINRSIEFELEGSLSAQGRCFEWVKHCLLEMNYKKGGEVIVVPELRLRRRSTRQKPSGWRSSQAPGHHNHRKISETTQSSLENTSVSHSFSLERALPQHFKHNAQALSLANLTLGIWVSWYFHRPLYSPGGPVTHFGRIEPGDHNDSMWGGAPRGARVEANASHRSTEWEAVAVTPSHR